MIKLDSHRLNIPIISVNMKTIKRKKRIITLKATNKRYHILLNVLTTQQIEFK